MPQEENEDRQAGGQSGQDRPVDPSEIDALVNELAGPNARPARGPKEQPPAVGRTNGVSSSQIDALIRQAEELTPTAIKATQDGIVDNSMTKFELKDLRDVAPEAVQNKIDLIKDVNLNVRVELGRRKMYIEEILKLGEGSVVELDKLADEPVDILVNSRLIARGEVLVLNDNFCVRVTEIVKRPIQPEQ